MKRIRLGLLVLVLFSSLSLFAAESLKSTEEEYYDFLFLMGYTQRPTLGYRTLSDSTWEISENLVWNEINLGTTRQVGNSDFSYQIYGPELFTSYNSAYPYGQNDGALVQSKGLNSSLSAGIRLEGKGFEITLKPQIAFTQNLEYPILLRDQAGYSEYAYYWASIDYPQRFGPDPFVLFDWGDTELRYTWKNVTVGFGTQAMWFGQSWMNPILHSNNAPGYPKADFGLRKTSVVIPHLGNIGEVEFRVYTSFPSYSDYYKPEYDTFTKKLITGLNVSYAPSFIPGMTFTFNKLFMTNYSWSNLQYYLSRLFYEPMINGEEDGKASFSAAWVFPKSGLEIYGELGIDDYVPTILLGGYIRYPFHTMIYTVGLKKTVDLNVEKRIYGEFFFEWNNNEMSQDFQFQWGYMYYSHPVPAGYTNNGQLLGGASCPGGNSQFLGFRFYYPKGQSMVYMHRTNPDNNYLYSKVAGPDAVADPNEKYFASFKATLAIGVTTDHKISSHVWLHGGLVYEVILNALYKTDVPTYGQGHDTILNNFRGEVGLKYSW